MKLTTDDSWLRALITTALSEDVGDGDHSSLASIPSGSEGRAKLLVKEQGVLAGVRPVLELFSIADSLLQTDLLIRDGARIKPGDIVLTVSGSVHSILRTERLALNIMQRMSGIATTTAEYVDAVSGYNARILDTRKTTPGIRRLEKEAVRIGGGYNHRMGLYDMIMLKDNHIDYAGGIRKSIERTKEYLMRSGKDLRIEIEARSIKDIEEIIETGGVHRVMLDNFTPELTEKAIHLIDGQFETESSGGITLENIRSYAKTGVDFISVGALTHHIKSLDLSLKAY